MSKPVDIAATATPQSQQPPLATQVQAQTVNDSLQNDSIANLRQISGALLAVHRCLTELQQHVDSIRTSIDSMLPQHTTNTTPLTTSSPQAAASSARAPAPAPAADTTSTPVPVPESSWESDPSEEEEEEEEVRSSPRSELMSTHRSELETLCEKEKDKEEEGEEEDVRSPPRSELISTHCSELESLCYKEVKVEDKEEEDVRCPLRSELRSLCDKEVIEEDKEEGDLRCSPRSELESLCDKEVIEEDKEEEDVRCPPRSELISTLRSELGSLCEKEVKEEDKEEEDVRFPPRSELISTPRSELESLCEMMDGRGLRRYMVMHLSDIKGLLEQVPKALRLSSNPARLVLECVGKFYTQKGKSFVKGSQMVQARKASVLVLQCFLLMGISDEIEIGVKQEAEQAALAWRKRLIAEAGILKAMEIDARGLLMLVGCFGIPGRFKNEDIRDLIWVIFLGQGRICKVLCSDSLRRSNVLMAKIPDIIEEMAKQKMEVDAAHIAYTFGIEDRVNPKRFLTSFLLESEESLKKMVEQSQGSLAAVDQAKRRHLFDLRSVIKCLELHDIDPSELLPGWQINEKIMSLETEITVGENLNKKKIARGAKMAQKRKIDETESSRKFSNKEPKHSHVPNPWLQQERVYSTPGQIGSHTGQLYGWLGNAAVYDRPASCSYAHPLSYLYWPR
ncbi:PREDICTED: FRIGIDA-like protein 1 [Nicotiana attenuata]|uniref:FRIGIDA-like protein n=1 Tax=Nicotiana attenuata TaxID=49451 RepID=A0A1J6IK79_NICAT|nr:PREDICTED: FRIGIDA-like protein 1 [Nicotiana attenuata]OIT05130.1 protein frigida [Nicotiana attenuata]